MSLAKVEVFVGRFNLDFFEGELLCLRNLFFQLPLS